MDRRIFYLFLTLSILSLEVSGGSIRFTGICRSPGCETTGPVCVIDESGVPKTFLNRCLAETAGCTKRTFYAEVKSGAC